MRTITVEIDGCSYLWNGSSWTDGRHLQPPTRVQPRLVPGLMAKLKRTPHARVDVELVTRAAESCLADGHLDDATALAQRVLRAKPDYVEAALVLAAVARRKRDPQTALEVTRRFVRRRRPDLHTVRAAALADLGRWKEAEKVVLRAMSQSGDEARPETVRVMARVMNAKVKAAA